MKHISLKDLARPYLLTARRLLLRDLRLTDLGYARRLSYSQFGEDLWLEDYFANQRSGFYVDIGAYDPFNASNTLLLYRRGWHGINVEPHPAAMARLRRFRPRDLNVEFAISESPEPATLILAGSFSGIDNADYLWPNSASKRVAVSTRRLDDLLIEHRPTGEIDLLDIDCEGHDLAVLKSNDWDRFRPRVVFAESHPGSLESVEAFLTGVKYRLLARLQLTLVFERI